MDNNTSLILVTIAEEILKDPEKRGYTGKTPSEIAKLLNAGYVTTTETVNQHPSRIGVILVNIPNAPSYVTEDMIIALINASKLDISIPEGGK